MQEMFLASGKAGSGKTHLVLQKFFRYVEEHKEDNVIFILPTHSQVEHLNNGEFSFILIFCWIFVNINSNFMTKLFIRRDIFVSEICNSLEKEAHNECK